MTDRETIMAELRAKGIEPVVVALPTCSWVVKVDDPVDSLITKAANAENPWSEARLTNLQAVADLEVGATCGVAVTKLSLNPKTGEQYPPLCGIHLSMARTRKMLAWDNSASKLRATENESVFEAAVKAAKSAGRAAGGDVILSNTSFAQYVEREQGGEWDSEYAGSVRLKLAHGRAAFVAAVQAATFTAGKRPMVVEV